MAKINISVSSNSSKPNITISKGPVGPQGEQGIQGEQGEQGPEGNVVNLSAIPDVILPGSPPQGSGTYGSTSQLAPNALVWDPNYDNGNGRWTYLDSVILSPPPVGSPPPGKAFVSPVIGENLTSVSSAGFTAISVNNGTIIPNDASLYVNGTSRFNGPVQVAANGVTVYALPVADGSPGQFMKTDGSGVVTFATPSVSDLSDGTSVMTTDTTQAVTGAKLFTSQPSFTNGLTVTNGTLSASGVTANLGTVVASGSVTTTQLNFASGASTIATAFGTSPEDLEIYSDGNVRIILDHNDDQASQKFVVSSSDDSERFSVQEDGVVRISNAYNLPSSDGSANYFLKTDGSGQLYFATVDGTSGNTAASPAPPPTYEIDDLTDVDTTSAAPSTNDTLVWNGTNWVPGSGSPWTTSGSDIYYTTGNVGIGTTTPAAALHIADANGEIHVEDTTNSLTTKMIFAKNNVIIGTGQGSTLPSTGGHVKIGYEAGRLNMGQPVTAIGGGALKDNSGQYHVAIGNTAGRYGSGSFGAAVGDGAGQRGMNYGSFLGYQAGQFGSGNGNLAVGYQAAKGVNGSSTFSNTVAVGYQALTALTTGTSNTAVGYQSGVALTTGSNNTFFGHSAGKAKTTGNFNTIIGRAAGANSGATKQSQTLVGYAAGQYNNGQNNSVLGMGALQYGSTSNSVAIGNQAIHIGGGGNDVAVGSTAGRNPTGGNNVSIGYQAGRGVQGTSTFANTVAVGYQALTALTTGANNTAVGYQAGVALTTGSSNTFIGNNNGSSLTTQSNNVLIGKGIGPTAVSMANTVAIGNDIVSSAAAGTYASQSNSVFIGHEVGKNVTTSSVSSNVWVGYQAGLNRNGSYETVLIGQGAGAGGSSMVAIGRQAMNIGGSSSLGIGHAVGANNSGADAVIVGNTAGQFGSTTESVLMGNWTARYAGGNYSVMIGHRASEEGTSHNSVHIGHSSGRHNDGDSNVAVGYQTLSETATGSTISNSVAVGYQALKGTTTSTASNTVAVGYQALTALTTGIGHTAVGYQAGAALTGSSANTFLGYLAGNSATQGNNTLIGYQAGRDLGSTSNLNSGNTFIGSNAGYLAAYQTNNTYIGVNAAKGNAGNNSYSSVVIGANAASYTNSGQTHTQSVMVGADIAGSSGSQGQTALIGYGANRFGGYGTVAVGHSAAYNAGGGSNVAIGFGSTLGPYNTPSSTKTLNVVIGRSTGAALLSGGNNVFLGSYAGSLLTSGSSNVFIGDNSGGTTTSQSNRLYIENSNSDTPLIYGEFDNDILRVNGTLQVNDPSSTGYAFPTATGTEGQALVVNANGDVEFGDVGVDGLTTSQADPYDISYWEAEVGEGFRPWNDIGAEEYQPWASFISPDGSKFYFIGEYGSDDELLQYTLDTPYSLESINSSSKVEVILGGGEGYPMGLHVANDPSDTSTYGKKFYIVGRGRDEVQEYTSTTAWDLSTLSSTPSSTLGVGPANNGFSDPAGLRFKPDGSAFFIVSFLNNQSVYVKGWDLSTNWDLTTASYNSAYDTDLGLTNRLTGIDFNADGTRMYIVQSDAVLIKQYSLSTAWDPSTYSFEKSLYVRELGAVANGEDLIYPSGLFIDHNSDYAYVCRWYNNQIIRLNRNVSDVSSQMAFNKTVVMDDGLRVKGNVRIEGGLSTNGNNIDVGSVNCGQVNFNSLFNGNLLYMTNGQAHIMAPYFRFAQTYNSGYGIKLIPDVSVRNTEAVDVTLPTQSGKIKVDTENYYFGNFDSSAESKLKSVSDVEIYYTARSDGNGSKEFALSQTPTAGQTIQRNIYYSDKAFADPNTPADWTLLSSFSGSNASFADTKTELYNQLNNRTVGTVPMSIKSTVSNAVLQSLRNDVFREMDLALGLRLINPNYTGSAIRVVNDSDIEADIGFSGEGLDTTALLNHCGSGNGYVVKIYDQSQGGTTGSGNDATHANNSLSLNKPQIVSSGSVVLQNGKPAMNIEDCQFVLNSKLDNYGEFNLTSVISPNMTASNQGMIIGDDAQRDIIWFNHVSQIETRWDSSTKKFSFSGTYSSMRNMGQISLAMWKESDNGIYMNVNNNPSVSSNSTSNHYGIYRLFNGWNTTAYDFVGSFQELVFWNGGLSSSERSEAESNINTYYSIY